MVTLETGATGRNDNAAIFRVGRVRAQVPQSAQCIIWGNTFIYISWSLFIVNRRLVGTKIPIPSLRACYFCRFSINISRKVAQICCTFLCKRKRSIERALCPGTRRWREAKSTWTTSFSFPRPSTSPFGCCRRKRTRKKRNISRLAD